MRAKWGSRGLRPPFGVSPNTSILLFCRRRRQEKGSAEGIPLLNAHAYGHPLWVLWPLLRLMHIEENHCVYSHGAVQWAQDAMLLSHIHVLFILCTYLNY